MAMGLGIELGHRIGGTIQQILSDFQLEINVKPQLASSPVRIRKHAATCEKRVNQWLTKVKENIARLELLGSEKDSQAQINKATQKLNERIRVGLLNVRYYSLRMNFFNEMEPKAEKVRERKEAQRSYRLYNDDGDRLIDCSQVTTGRRIEPVINEAGDIGNYDIPYGVSLYTYILNRPNCGSYKEGTQ